MSDSPSNSRVHVVNFAGHDYSGAREWGELSTMVEGYIRPDRVDRILYNVAEYITLQTKAEDWLLPSGLLLLNIFAAVCWLQRHGSLKLLIFDRKSEREYREVHLTRDHIDSLLEHFAERETA